VSQVVEREVLDPQALDKAREAPGEDERRELGQDRRGRIERPRQLGERRPERFGQRQGLAVAVLRVAEGNGPLPHIDVAPGQP
jgi:hypothetical protein